MSKRPSKLARSLADARKVLAEVPALPLLVGIFRGNKLVRIDRLPDPRVVFCQGFNEQAAEFGLEARLVPDYAAAILARDNAKGGAV